MTVQRLKTLRSSNRPPTEEELSFAFDWFGLTNDESHLLAARQYRLDALADGWLERPEDRSPAVDEDVEVCTTLVRLSGWKMSVLARTNKPENNFKYQASVSVWAPDGMQVCPAVTYSKDQLIAGLRRCAECKATDVDTFRHGPAGRWCDNCLRTNG